jgi:hypothetical protein
MGAGNSTEAGKVPNLIVSMYREMARVRNLLPRLPVADRADAEKILRFAEINIASNSYEQMQDSLQELESIGRAKKPEPE